MKINAKIKSISAKELDRDGNAYTDKFGNEQARVSMQIEHPDYEGVWLSAFVKHGDYVTTWHAGETHEIEVTKKGDFVNFKAIKASPHVIEKLRAGAGQILAPMSPAPYHAPQPKSLPARDREGILEEKTQLDRIEEMVKEIHGQIINPL